jgi:hypothetical protein
VICCYILSFEDQLQSCCLEHLPIIRVHQSQSCNPSHQTQSHILTIMTHYTTPAASQFFTITQTALGSPLQFEPAVGSKELDSMIHSYLPGPGSISQKRGRVVVDFLDSIERLGFPHPVCLRYFVPTVPMSQSASPASTPADVKTSTPLKRQREESTEPASDARRLPGFSILTKDGVDITEYASRGPKTKEQREHAALMRKLKACAACKRSKQRVRSSQLLSSLCNG